MNNTPNTERKKRIFAPAVIAACVAATLLATEPSRRWTTVTTVTYVTEHDTARKTTTITRDITPLCRKACDATAYCTFPSIPVENPRLTEHLTVYRDSKPYRKKEHINPTEPLRTPRGKKITILSAKTEVVKPARTRKHNG